MRPIKIIAGGKIKNSSYASLFADYEKRLSAKLTLVEISTKKSEHIPQIIQLESEFILSKITPQDYVIALDERGKTLTSEKFAETLNSIDLMEGRIPCFIIGGAEGLSDAIRKRADQLMSFGAQTWPHLMVRVMLVEQLYRAEQISKGHPYHRR